MNGERTTFKLQGMNDGPNPEPGWAERIVNLTCDADGVWRNCTDWWWIFTNCDTPPTHYSTTVAFQSMYWWGQRGTARQWLVFERAVSATQVNLEVFDGVGRGLLTLATDRVRVATPDPGSTYIPIGGWLYIINGYDKPVRWNGRGPDYGMELEQVGFTANPPPPNVKVGAVTTDGLGDMAALTGEAAANPHYANTTGYLTGLDPDWRYGYAITYLNAAGAESPPSEVSFAADPGITASGSTWARTAIVTWNTPPANIKAIRLYRTTNLATAPSTAEGVRYSLYHVRDIPAAATASYIDALPDAMLGHQLDLPNVGLFPRGAKHAAYFKGTLFLAGAPSYPDRVFYSAPGMVEQFPPANTFDLVMPSAEIMGLHATQNALVVFTRRGVHLIRGSPTDGFFLHTISSEVGCIAPGAVADVPGERPGVLFFDVEGPYLLQPGEDGPSALTFIGHGIRAFWSCEVNTLAMAGARCARHRRDQELLFIVPTNGVPASQQMGLVYHYIHGYWSLRNFHSTALFHSVLGARIDALCEIDDARGLVAVGSDDVYISGPRHVIADTDDEGCVWMYRLGWMGPRTSRASVARLEVLGHFSAIPAGAGLIWKTNPHKAVAVRWRADRKDMPEVDFTLQWDPANDSPVVYDVQYPQPGMPNMVTPEYEADTWDLSRWDTGVWAREVPQVYAFDAHVAGYEVQFEIAGGYIDVGPVAMSAAAIVYVGSPEQDPWSQQRGSARP